MNIDDVRKQFEKRFPLPYGVVYSATDDKYIADETLKNKDTGAYQLIRKVAWDWYAMWTGYQICAEHKQIIIDGLQAKIDALMLEHCPDEMTAKQIEAWGDAQQPARENGVWNVEDWPNGVCLQSSDFTHDVTLQIQGDFECKDQKIEYANELCNRLNGKQP